MTQGAGARGTPKSIAELRQVAQPPEVLGRANAEHWAGRLYGRRISVYLTRVALRLGLSPNAVTAIMIIVGLAGAGLLAVQGLWAAVVAFLLVQLYMVLDCVDGEIARWTGQTSVKGVYLDRLGHYLVEGAILAMLGVRAVGDDGGLGWVVVGLLAALGALIAKAETDLVAMARLEGGLGPMPQAATSIEVKSLAGARRVAAFVPIHRALHAIEAAYLFLGAAIIDQLSDTLTATRTLVVVVAVLAWLIAFLHLVSILNSTRLTAKEVS
jgi:phosphatidylglycerophosphate synthase